MTYEIMAKNKDGKTWSIYAYTDVATNAFEICSAINLFSDGEFAVFKKGKEVKSIKEAMKYEN